MYPTLPNGIADFRLLRTEADRYLYVDKTEDVAALAAHLLHDPQLFFARPRRFGKTLLVSTLEALFTGEKTLFEDTWLGRRGHWDWGYRQYPVLRLQMDIRDMRTREELANELRGLVTDLAQTAGIAVETDRSPSRMLSRALRALHKARGRKAVVLIDEYDTPITDNIGRPEALADVLSMMRAFYGTLKRQDECIRCIFMTGITRFSQAGLFSGANHFRDVSLFPEYNSLLGFTQADLRNTPALATDVAQCARNVGCTDEELREALRRYYDTIRLPSGKLPSSFFRGIAGGAAPLLRRLSIQPEAGSGMQPVFAGGMSGCVAQTGSVQALESRRVAQCLGPVRDA